MKYIGLHGILSKGNNSTDRILKLLDELDYTTMQFDYCISVFDLYYTKKLNKIVDMIESHYAEGDVIIAHSAGCVLTVLLANRLAKKGIEIPVVWFFNAAVNKNITLPSSIGHLYNYRDMHDNVLLFTRLMQSKLVGDMGRVGYEGISKNVTDIHLRELLRNDFDNHGDLFDKKAVRKITYKIIIDTVVKKPA